MSEEEAKEKAARELKLREQVDLHIGIIAHNAPISDGKQISILTSTQIPKDGFNHGFTTRFGGISTYQTLSSLNLCYNAKKKDPLVNVQENRRRLAGACGFRIATFHPAKTCHGSTVWVVGDPEPENYDALVTNHSHVTLAAPGADCAILLFCDPVKKVGAGRASFLVFRSGLPGYVVGIFSCGLQNLCWPLSPPRAISFYFLRGILRWKMIILVISTTAPIRFSLKGWDNVHFELGNEKVKMLGECTF